MKDIITWLGDNREWVFSGIGVFAVGLVGAIFRFGRSVDKETSNNLSLVQSPTVNQAPVVNINNQAAPTPPKSARIVTPKVQAPIFALNPVVVTRNVEFIDPKLSDDGMAEVCIARFRFRQGQQGTMQGRFEASIDYVENLRASGMPYESRAGHINRAQWLPPNNGEGELLLLVERNYLLYAVNAVEQSTYRDRVVELELHSVRPFVAVTLTDLTNGQKWQIKFQITYDPRLHNLAVREISSLRSIS